MKNKYTIYNILKYYEENFNNKITIKFEDNTNIDFYFDRRKLAHLMGLHYCNKKQNNADNIADYILKNKIIDKEILFKVKNNNLKFLKAVKNRNDFIEEFLNTLENGYLTLINKSINSDIKSVNFIVETKDKKFLEMGLGIDNSEQYYIETFLVRNNDNNIDYSIHKNIESIYIIKDNEYIPFSFDKEKNKKLIEEFYKDSKNFNYKKILEKDKVININAWNQKKESKNLER